MKNLTKQQDRVAELTAKGYSAKEIANTLFISLETAQWHQKIIRQKTGAKNIADITRMYILTNPQKFFVAIVFLVMQSVITVVDTGLELRKPKTNRIVRSVKSGRRIREYLIEG